MLNGNTLAGNLYSLEYYFKPPGLDKLTGNYVSGFDHRCFPYGSSN